MSVFFVSGFEKKRKEVAGATAAALRAVGVFVKGEYVVRLGAHVRTGYLRGSADFKVLDDKAVRVGASADYAAFLEFGTSRMRAWPCLRPALDDNADKIQALFKEVIGGVL